MTVIAWTAMAVLVAYLALAAAVFWRRRPRVMLDDNGHWRSIRSLQPRNGTGRR